MKNQHLGIGQEVTVVGDDKKNSKGKITEVITEDIARIDYDGGTIVASFSEDKKPGTFHFEQASPKEEHHKTRGA